MKYFLLLVAVCVTLLSCNNFHHVDKSKSFNQFDFSYNDFFTTCFSIKFTQGDTVFIQQHFAPFSDTLKSSKNYYAVLNKVERQKIDSFLFEMNFATYDTSYYESYEDGHYYQFFISNDSLQKTVFVHSDSIPTELKAFAYWIVATKRKLKHYRIDTTMDFGSLIFFFL